MSLEDRMLQLVIDDVPVQKKYVHTIFCILLELYAYSNT